MKSLIVCILMIAVLAQNDAWAQANITNLNPISWSETIYRSIEGLGAQSVEPAELAKIDDVYLGFDLLTLRQIIRLRGASQRRPYFTEDQIQKIFKFIFTGDTSTAGLPKFDIHDLLALWRESAAFIQMAEAYGEKLAPIFQRLKELNLSAGSQEISQQQLDVVYSLVNAKSLRDMGPGSPIENETVQTRRLFLSLVVAGSELSYKEKFDKEIPDLKDSAIDLAIARSIRGRRLALEVGQSPLEKPMLTGELDGTQLVRALDAFLAGADGEISDADRAETNDFKLELEALFKKALICSLGQVNAEMRTTGSCAAENRPKAIQWVNRKLQKFMKSNTTKFVLRVTLLMNATMFGVLAYNGTPWPILTLAGLRAGLVGVLNYALFKRQALDNFLNSLGLGVDENAISPVLALTRSWNQCDHLLLPRPKNESIVRE